MAKKKKHIKLKKKKLKDRNKGLLNILFVGSLKKITILYYIPIL